MKMADFTSALGREPARASARPALRLQPAGAAASPDLAEALAARGARSQGMRAASLRQLKAFSLVARHHSFVRAAEELCLTPPAVSLQIKELEHALGLALFERTGKTVLLTPGGELLLADVQRALLALHDADETLNRLRGGPSGAMRVGMVSNAMYFLPRLLAQYHAQHPDIELQISVGNRAQLIDRLRRGEVEFAIMGAPPTDLRVHAEAFASQPLAVVAAPGHALTRQRSIPVARLAQHEFIVREQGSGTRAAMDRYFRDAGSEPPRGIEMSSNEGIKQAVMGGMGLAFLSLHTAGLELGQDLLVALDAVGLPLVRSWFAVHSESAALTREAQALRSFIVHQASQAITQQFEGLLPCAAGAAGAAAVRRGRPSLTSLP